MSIWPRLAVFDLETTGVDVDASRIVSACVAVLDGEGEVLNRWDWLADPGIPIPEGASAVHGITTEIAQLEGRSALEVVTAVTQTLRVLSSLGMPVVVYNAPYDLTLLDRECRRHGVDPLGDTLFVIDPLVIDKALDRYRKGKRTLEITAGVYGVPLADAHDAGADAIAAGRVALALARAYPEELDVTLPDLHGRQAIWYAEQAASFQDYIRRVRGDETFVADDDWPLRPIDAIGLLTDTVPHPGPAPRPSETVPIVDLETGTVVLPGAPPPVAAPRVEPIPILAPPPAAPTIVPIEEVVIGAEDLPAPNTAPAGPVGGPARARAASKRPAVTRVAAGILTDATGRCLAVRVRGAATFSHPGGEMLDGESAIDALARHLRAQLGLDPDLDATEYLGSHRFASPDPAHAVVRAEVFAVGVNGLVFASELIDEVAWIDLDEVERVPFEALSRETIVPLWVSRRSALF